MKNARQPDQIKKMVQLKKDGVCFLCNKNFTKYQDTPILREKKWWVVRKNDYPYEGSKIHLLLVYKKHTDSIESINPEGMVELFDHLRWVRKKFKIKGSTLIMRFGDSSYTGATITHLHAHLVSGHRYRKGSEKIRPVVGFGK